MLEVFSYLILAIPINCFFCVAHQGCSKTFKLLMEACHGTLLSMYRGFQFLVEALTSIYGEVIFHWSCPATDSIIDVLKPVKETRYKVLPLFMQICHF